MSCHPFAFRGGSGFICGPAVYEITLRGRVYTVSYHSYCGPVFVLASGEPWKRQPYNGELWEIGERMIWGLCVPSTAREWAEGEERLDGITGAKVRRVW